MLLENLAADLNQIKVFRDQISLKRIETEMKMSSDQFSAAERPMTQQQHQSRREAAHHVTAEIIFILSSVNRCSGRLMDHHHHSSVD